MQRSVALACFLTSCPRTRACSFTMPLSAHRAVRACHATPDESVVSHDALSKKNLQSFLF